MTPFITIGLGPRRARPGDSRELCGDPYAHEGKEGWKSLGIDFSFLFVPSMVCGIN